ncbi:hypothetical protein [Henriciella marina]|uniref:hypothetical protein n=1 Tax=Henriciella marina TaxID=453851 RepID=UPI00036D015E|nr:hypothetical protein [Henriciella marina]
MPEWIIPAGFIALFVAIMAYANLRMGKPRKDGRPNQLNWGLIMVFCVLGIFLMVVHLLNIAGLETGPEHSVLGRF